MLYFIMLNNCQTGRLYYIIFAMRGTDINVCKQIYMYMYVRMYIIHVCMYVHRHVRTYVCK